LVIGFAWVAYGLLIYFLLSHEYLTGIGHLALDNFGQFIPSVRRIGKITDFDVTPAKMHVSIMLLSMPILFAALLFSNIENRVAGVRRKGKELKAVVILVSVASLVFVAGFNHHIGRDSLIGVTILSTMNTGLSALLYRTAFCIAFKK